MKKPEKASALLSVSISQELENPDEGEMFRQNDTEVTSVPIRAQVRVTIKGES